LTLCLTFYKNLDQQKGGTSGQDRRGGMPSFFAI